MADVSSTPSTPFDTLRHPSTRAQGIRGSGAQDAQNSLGSVLAAMFGGGPWGVAPKPPPLASLPGAGPMAVPLASLPDYGKVPSPDFTAPPPGLRPRPSDAFVPNLGAAKSIAAGAVEPFGQLGRVMTGQSQDVPTDLLGAAAGLAPVGPPGAGRALKAGAEGAAEHILGAAVTGANGKIFTAPNHLLAREAAAKEFGVHPDDVWGHLEPDVGRFLTSAGRMVDRTEAGKIIDQAGPLFAENLFKGN